MELEKSFPKGIPRVQDLVMESYPLTLTLTPVSAQTPSPFLLAVIQQLANFSVYCKDVNKVTRFHMNGT